MRVTCARAGCVAVALAAAAAWMARGGSDIFVMWLMAPFLVSAAGRSAPAVFAAAVPATIAGVLGPARLAQSGPARIDTSVLLVTAAALACAGLVLAADAHRRRPAEARRDPR
jgi:hypothetical protein